MVICDVKIWVSSPKGIWKFCVFFCNFVFLVDLISFQNEAFYFLFTKKIKFYKYINDSSTNAHGIWELYYAKLLQTTSHCSLNQSIKGALKKLDPE